MILLITGSDACRIGEAANPGPVNTFDFTLGTFNAAGASTRVDTILDLPPGLWGCTESQLSLSGQRQFDAALKFQGRQRGRQIRTVYGAPAPTRTLTSSAGTWTGVFQMTDFPIRELTCDWEGAEFLSGRVVLSTTYVGPLQITGGTIYGPAQSPTFKQPLRMTRELLQSVEEQVIFGCAGCRYLCGDWNADLADLSIVDRWKAMGWKEVQLAALEWWHQPVQPTCKQTTIRDYVFVSPELWAMLKSVEVTANVFPDHAMVAGVFEVPLYQSPFLYWPMPASLPWDQVNIEAWRHTVNANFASFTWKADLTSSFATWSTRVEQSLDGFVLNGHGHLPGHTRGRGQYTALKVGKMAAPIVKAARPGEEALSSSFIGTAIKRWYKQLRRLQALLHCCRNGYHTAGSWTHQAQTWHAIKVAAGFRPNFMQWWPARPIKLQASPAELSEGLPKLEDLEYIWQDFRLNFRHFESSHLQKRKKILQAKREQCSKTLYKVIKPPLAAPLDLLFDKQVGQIQQVDVATGLVQIPRSLSDMSAVHEVQKEKMILRKVIIDVEDDPSTCWALFDSDRLLVPGHEVTQIKPVVELDDIHSKLTALWTSRWKQMAEVPENAWDRIMGFAVNHFPVGSIPYEALVPSTLRRTLRKGSGLRTRGPDGWSKTDVLSLPDAFLGDLCQMYGMIEAGQDWPQQLVRGHITCLAKNDDSLYACDYRPITLFSLLYRLWSSSRSRMLLTHLAGMADFEAFGYLPGRSCGDLTYLMQAQIENALLHGEALCGVQLDIQQCFNRIPRAPLLYLARRLGIPRPILVAWRNFLRQMQRSFKVRCCFSPPVSSDTGLPEGDSLSCVGMLVLNFSFHCYMRHYEPSIRSLSYVDNLELIAVHPAQLQRAVLVAETWADMLRLPLDRSKPVYWALQSAHRAILATFDLRVEEHAKDLGAPMQYSGRHRNSILQARILNVLPAFGNLRKCSLGRWFKALLLRTAILPRALHGSTHVVLGQQWIRKLRTHAMRSLNDDRAGANPATRLAMIYPIMTDPGF